ncbi:hypothetical protein BU16DRAFT_462065, partial [Lophium mytilinum]
FIAVYINNVLIYSRFKEDYLYYLNKVINTLKIAGVTLALAKYFFRFSSLEILGYYVSRLGLSTLDKKTEVIKNIRFLKTLYKLKSGLAFFR